MEKFTSYLQRIFIETFPDFLEFGWCGGIVLEVVYSKQITVKRYISKNDPR